MGLTERSFLERMEEMGFTPRKSNADYIRSMTDEDLANEIARYIGCIHCKIENPWYTCERTFSECRSGWLEWLKKERI